MAGFNNGYNAFQYNGESYSSTLDLFLYVYDTVGPVDVVTPVKTDGPCPGQYNAFEYNGCTYNDTPEIILYLTETVNMTATALQEPQIILTDTTSAGVDNLTKTPNPTILDSILLNEDGFQLQVGKGFSDDVRIAIWLDEDRKPPNSQWSDQ